MKYTIIIPAYNEESRIEATVRDYASYYETLPTAAETEVLIVVNGSGDRTAEISERLEQELASVRTWATPAKMGKGGAVLKGFELSKGEIIAFTDADNATSPQELYKLFQAIEDGVECAIGSRWLPESLQEIPQPLGRRIASRVFNLIVRILFQINLTDTQCGAKAFRTTAIRTLLNEMKSRGWAFDVELLWRLKQNNHSIREIPIVWRDNSQSRLRLHVDGPAMLWELIKLRLRG